MKILVLGGTAFLGRHLVNAAVSRGHTVTVFSRGRHGEPPRGVRWLHGDRNTDLSLLAGLRWDAVVDTSGYVPSRVRAAAALLAEHVAHYTFVSSLSVYANSNQGPIDESGTLEEVPAEKLESLEAIVPSGPITSVAYGSMYGGLKALCERAATEAMGGRIFIVRPGLIVGPYDYTDRFTYWPGRIARGGEVLAPGDPRASRRFIDVRDLSAWLVASMEKGRTGTYNATGPDYDLTMERILDECRKVTGSDARFTWVDDDFLVARHADPWIGVPLWVPRANEPASFRGTFQRALDAGLHYRALSDTIRDTLAWDQIRPPDRQRNGGLSSTQERDLLAAWHAAR
ncbi:MAG TPA: NAD-dependent epimerase/dehydratase family protein [Polyangiaceae bacterium]|jgi:2'-hydroxyisoflavone reductase|nr:NAD-dependent epimerase/dehydratase family protein [Polyangiaceae bacterium]